MVDVVCPQCTTLIRADPGSRAQCANCGYSGGVVPAPHEVQTFQPRQEFLPSNPFPQEEEEEEAAPKETSRTALTALILGFAGIPLFLAGPVAVGFGIAGIIDVNKNPELRGKGLAVIGLVFGILTSIVWVVFIVMLFAAGGRLVQGF